LKAAANYWFMFVSFSFKSTSFFFFGRYEATPGGKLDQAKGFMYRSNGKKTMLSEKWNENLGVKLQSSLFFSFFTFFRPRIG